MRQKAEKCTYRVILFKNFQGEHVPNPSRALDPAGLHYAAAGHVVYSSAIGDTFNETAA